MDKKDMKERVNRAIDKKREEIIGFGEKIYKNPETGFKEYVTSKSVAEKFKELGVAYTEIGDIPGVKLTLDTGKKGPGVAILGEMDAIVCTEHKDCNRANGAVHACGHNMQVASMLGAAIGILESGAMADMSGKLHFIAVPAEEYIEIDFRMDLQKKGRIKYLGGKPELLYRGVFDDVDISMMVHALPLPEGQKVNLDTSDNGCIVKKINYIGKASHAGGAPDKGINALYAAQLGMSAINAIRETFIEEDYIRVHPIITKGGDIVNVIPCDVSLETYIRGKTMDAILEANKKVNRALLGGAVAMGAKVAIEDIPGYFPMISDKNLSSIAKTVMNELVNENEIGVHGHSTGSTDMGDLSTLMPVIEPYIGGFKGALHSADFKLTEPDTAYILGAKLLANTALELLWENAGCAESVIKNFTPKFKSKQEYFDFVDRLFSKKLLPEHDFEV